MYDCFVGLEIHIHLLTESKMFCDCKTSYGDEPNTNVCPVCLGYPGVLPIVNERAMELGYTVAKALNCKLSKATIFERKNYFYPDMTKNYQISQFREPVGVDGYLDFTGPDGNTKRIRIHDVHLEEDAGKMIHAGDMSLCDYNRAGYPLLEIVTEPDLSGGSEAELFLQYFQRFVRYLGVSNGNMDEGSMKSDVNVSINTPGAGLGTKVEMKNLNSSRFARKCIEYEFKRQSEALDQGKKLRQETRLWNANRDVTEVMRTKESSNDYRYFPEPDLPPYSPSEAFLKKVDVNQVELPLARKERYIKDFGLTLEQAEFVVDQKFTADYFDSCLAAGAHGSVIANWLTGDVQKELKHFNLELKDSPLTASRLTQIIKLQETGRIHIKIAKQLLDAVFEEKKDPEVIVKEKGWEVMVESELFAIIDQVFAQSASVVEAIKAGDARQKGFLVGQIMKASAGRASPPMVNKLLEGKLT